MKLRNLVTILVCVFSLVACSSPGDNSGGNGVDATGNAPSDVAGGGDSQSTTASDSIWTVDSTSSLDTGVAPPSDTGVAPPLDTGTVVKPDTTAQIDTVAPMDFDPSGLWLLVANPSSQEFCGQVQVFDDQVLVLTVTNDGHATGILEPPEWFLTLNFDGTLSGSQLTMTADYTEAGPPSIGWATEHTHTMDVTITSKTDLEGSYVHELVPNTAEPCTRYWNITGTKQ